MASLEDALKKLDRLTQEEARMALAEILRITDSVRDEVKVVDGKVERVEDKLEDMDGKIVDMGGKVADMGDKVEGMGDTVEDISGKVEDIGDIVHCVDEKVQIVIDGTRSLSSRLLKPSKSIFSDSKQARVVAKEANLIIHQAVNGIDEIKCPPLVFACCSRLHLLTGDQLKQLLRTWLSPADPSTNHNIARKAQHTGTAVWFFQGKIVIEWKSTGSLLWIHGKRAFLQESFRTNAF
jgi:hypothetical protein